MRDILKRILCLLLLAAMFVNGVVLSVSAESNTTITVADGVELQLDAPHYGTTQLRIIQDEEARDPQIVDVYVIEDGATITWPSGYTVATQTSYYERYTNNYMIAGGGIGLLPSDPSFAEPVTFPVGTDTYLHEVVTMSYEQCEAFENGEDVQPTGVTYFICKSLADSWVPVDQSQLLVQDGTFNFKSTLNGGTGLYPYHYDESWFLESPYEYNHDLAKMSMRVALSAAQTDDDDVRQIFIDLGYENISSYYVAPADNTIGYLIACKEIVASNGTPYVLISVAIRGGGYGQEWANNFLVGNDSKHVGFSDAADKVFDSIKVHITKSYGTDKNFKIWITGFSRAAAVANLTAQKLCIFADNEWGYLEPSDIFAYCFECPNGARGGMLYKNIINIINPFDIVPMVAPDSWSFSRYGVDYYLPSIEINYNGFHDAMTAMKEQYRNITGSVGVQAIRVEEYTLSMPAQHTVLNKLVNALAELLDSDDYAEKYQKSVVAVVNKFTAKTDPALSESGFIDLIKAILDIRGLVGALKSPVKAIIEAIEARGAEAVAQIQYAHYPELCLAWMDAITDAEMTTSAYTRYLKVNCPVNVSVYDSEGVLVAQIIDDVVQEIEGGIAALVDENGQKIIVMPFDEEFKIVTTATDSGEMSYQVEEYDLAAVETLRVINYYDVEIVEGDELTGTAGTSTEAKAEYTLEGADGSELSATIEQTGDEVNTFSVLVDNDGNGAVTGGGTFVIGEFAKLTAVPEYDEEFLGWYCGDELISVESEYRFRVEWDMEIVGKFTRNHTTVVRIAGTSRSRTAYKAADELKEVLGIEKFDTIILSSGDNFADALAGSYLAAVKKAPILLYRPNALNENADYITANLADGGKVYILGGTASVSQEMEDTLTTAGIRVERLAGSNRYNTNLAILKEAGINGNEILVSTGLNFADSLSASATGKPILLVNSNSNKLTDSQIAFLKEVSGAKLTIIGGTSSVSQELAEALSAYGTVGRVSGPSREKTSVAVAERYFPDADCAMVAYSRNYPDGLCGGPLAYILGAPLLLTDAGRETPAQVFVEAKGITRGIALGGPASVKDSSVRIIFGMSDSDVIQTK